MVKRNSDSEKFESWESIRLDLNKVNTDTGTLSGLGFKFVDLNDLYTDYGGVGRGTTIIPVQAMGGTTSLLAVDESGTLVAKIAWPPACRVAEDEFVKKISLHLRRKHRNILKRIVDIKCSMTSSRRYSLM